MSILSYMTALCFAAAGTFEIWYFIYGCREYFADASGSRKRAVAALIPAVFNELIITADLRMSLVILEQYGSEGVLKLLFHPVAALATAFLLIPAAVKSRSEDSRVCELPLLILTSVINLLFNFLCLSFIHDNSFVPSSLAYLTAGILCSLTVMWTPRLSRDRYREELLKIEEKLSGAQSAHYEAVKKSNFELRRARHDMKNHLIAIRELAEHSGREELLSYLDSLSKQIEAAAPPFRSGNDIADAILADKYAKAEKRGLKLEMSGDLYGLEIEAADLVTILSNLLDNAIEAVSRIYGMDVPADAKKIVLEFRKNKNYLFIIQKNPGRDPIDTAHIRSSKNSPDHGFGIHNIRRTVRKYGGEYRLECTKEAAIYLIETEIILPLV